MLKLLTKQKRLLKMNWNKHIQFSTPSEFEKTIIQCYCFNDKREISDCICLYQYYNENEYKNEYKNEYDFSRCFHINNKY